MLKELAFNYSWQARMLYRQYDTTCPFLCLPTQLHDNITSTRGSSHPWRRDVWGGGTGILQHHFGLICQVKHLISGDPQIFAVAHLINNKGVGIQLPTNSYGYLRTKNHNNLTFIFFTIQILEFVPSTDKGHTKGRFKYFTTTHVVMYAIRTIIMLHSFSSPYRSGSSSHQLRRATWRGGSSIL